MEDILGFVIAIGLLLVSVSSQNELSKANDHFAVELYKAIGDANGGQNVFFSPISVSVAFAMVSLGAHGQTKEQMKEALNLNKTSDREMKRGFKELLTAFNNQSFQTNNYTLRLVDGLFVSDSFTLEKRFLEDAKRYFNAFLEELNFMGQPDKSRNQINRWVAKRTNQKVKKLLRAGSVTRDTVMIVVNAIYFKASWVFPFDKKLTKPGIFKISKDGEQHTIMDMMHLRNSRLNYYNSSELGFEVLELPYQGNTASMFIFLPYAKLGLSYMETKLTGKTLVQTLNTVQRSSMDVQLPRFGLTEDISLKQFLIPMGMIDVFDVTKANLSGIASGPLFVTDAFMKAFVNVTESGTEAAAATAITIGNRAIEQTIPFIVDRPFLFLIYDKPTQSVLFLGRFVRPPSSN